MFSTLGRGSANAAGTNSAFNAAIRGSPARLKSGHRDFKRTIAATRCLDQSIPAGKTHRAKYSPVWTSRVKTPWVEALQARRNAEELATKGMKPVPTSQGPNVDLTPQRMDNSCVATVRLGAILMDLDGLAGMVAYRHTGDSVMTVTAAVDRIVIEHPLKEICDLELSGKVTYATGRSSMEVSLQVANLPAEGETAKPEDVMITCAFTMVSLDPTTRRPVAVAPLLVETEEEKQLFQKGEKNYKAKKEMRAHHLLREEPNDEESTMIHDMWLKEMAYKDPHNPVTRPLNVIHMQDTVLKTIQIMQPTFRNLHNFMIFGGYLLQQTFELAFCCASTAAGTRPTFLSLDPSTFDNPVPVGSHLYLKATVSFTDPVTGHEASAENQKFTKIQVRVDSSVRDTPDGLRKPTGVFHYTFLVQKDVHVMPQSYSDFMIWLDAKRRAQDTNAKLLAGITESNSLSTIRAAVTE
ncbi:hypothetical protein KEM56_002240 [Ascosphaera pollenicola]|nr:hypothetical protein KEM56_002240 [Ascosphaera pollenicola]